MEYGVTFLFERNKPLWNIEAECVYYFTETEDTNTNIVDYQLHPCFANSSIAIAQCDINGNFVKKNTALIKLAGSDNNSIFTLILDSYHVKIREYFLSNRINNVSFDVQLNGDNNIKYISISFFIIK